MSSSEEHSVDIDTMTAQTSPQESRIGFFSLDRVVRDVIYNMVLNSGNYTECLLLRCSRDHDHQLNYLNSTNLLMVCRQIYREAVGLLHKKEVIVKVPEPVQGHTTWGSTGTMFRHPKAFGKPKVFAQSRSPYERWLPLEMSELEFVRLRKLALVIPLPLENQTVWEPRKVWTGQELRKYHRKLKHVASALAKCTHLETVRLLLDRNKSDDLSRGKMKKIMRKDRFYGTAKLLMNIVRAADSTGATVSLGRHQIFETVNHSHDTEPLVPWLLQTSLHAGIVVEREQDPPKDWKQKFDEEYQSWATSRHNPGDKASRLKWEVASLTGEAFLKPKVLQPSLVYGMHPKDLLGVTKDAPDFRLIPECRGCYAIFSTREGLEKHLKKNTSHQIPFTSKNYNELDEYFWNDSWRKCPTCGECFLCLGEWHGHIHEYDHDRATIVPRWTEDNEWWEKRYKELCDEGRLDLLGAKVA